MECVVNEMFGLVVLIYLVVDVDEVVEKVNDIDYGFNVSVWVGFIVEGQRIVVWLWLGMVNVDEGYVFVWGSFSVLMGGMGFLGVGCWYGLEGLFKYIELQMIVIVCVFNFDLFFGILVIVWQKLLLFIVCIVMKFFGCR